MAAAGVAAGIDTDTLWVLHRAGRIWAADTFSAASNFERVSDESVIAEPVVLQLAKDTGAVLRCARGLSGVVTGSASNFRARI